MPIYAYKCTSCGYAKDVLQKMSDPLLTVCPECGQDTFAKQVTAAGFRLKGSGWYVTDFRGNDGKAPESDASAAAPGKAAESSTGGASTAASAPAAAPAPATAAPAASAPAAGSTAAGAGS